MKWKNEIIDLIKDIFYQNEENDDLLLMDMYSEYNDKLFFVSRKVDINITFYEKLHLEWIKSYNENKELELKFVNKLKKIQI